MEGDFVSSLVGKTLTHINGKLIGPVLVVDVMVMGGGYVFVSLDWVDGTVLGITIPIKDSVFKVVDKDG